MLWPVLGLLLLESNLLHITLQFEETLCTTVTYYLRDEVTSNILYEILLYTIMHTCIR